MAETPLLRLWSARIGYLLVALVLMLIKLLPFSNGTAGFPAPDLLVLVTCVWVLRRPDAVPVRSVAGVFLLADILFSQPLGLWAAIMVGLTEFLRRREVAWRDIAFPLEWALVSVAIAAATLGYAVILAVFVVDQPGLGLTLLRLLATLACYPAGALLARAVGLRKSAPGDADRIGAKA